MIKFTELELRVAAAMAVDNPGAEVWGPYCRLPRRLSEGSTTGRYVRPRYFQEFDSKADSRHDLELKDRVSWP